jgi:ATP-dependent DNA helicase RecG
MSGTQIAFDFEGPLALLTVEEIYDRASVELLQALEEDRRIERKPVGIHPQKLSEWFSMWANTAPDGGILVIGIEDDGDVSGCLGITQKDLNRLEKTGMDYCPDARFESKRISCGDTDFLLLFRIFYRTDKVVKTNSREAYARVGDSKRKLTQEEIRELEIDKGQLEFELA